MRHVSLIALGLAVAVATPCAFAQTIYRCHKAEGGGLLFQDKPCSTSDTVEARHGSDGDAVGDTSVDSTPTPPGSTAADHYERYLALVEQEHQEARADAIAEAQLRAAAARSDAAAAPAQPGPVTACEPDSDGAIPLGCNGYPVYGGFHYPTHFPREGEGHRHDGNAYVTDSHGVLVYHPPRNVASGGHVARLGGVCAGPGCAK